MKNFTLKVFVFFFLALGVASAQEEVEPQAYETQPAVLIVLKPGDTFEGICRQIETEGNLPPVVKDSVECGLRVAENFSGLMGEDALEAAKRVPAGAAVLFPFKTIEQVRAASEERVSALEGELKGASEDLNVALKRVKDRETLALAMEKIAREKDELAKNFAAAERKAREATAQAKKASAEKLVALQERDASREVTARIAKISAEREAPPVLDLEYAYAALGLMGLALLYACIRSFLYRRGTVQALLAKDREISAIKAGTALALSENRRIIEKMTTEAEFAKRRNGAVETFSLPNEPEVSAEFVVVSRKCSCGAEIVLGNEIRHLAHAHKQRSSNVHQIMVAAR